MNINVITDYNPPKTNAMLNVEMKSISFERERERERVYAYTDKERIICLS